MFDAHQNSFTQEIERQYFERLGLSQEMISNYYSFRTGYLIKANCASGVAGSQKTSGEPGTLLNNGIVSKVISNWLLRGDGPQVILYKGDDFVKHQCELKMDENRKKLLDSACALKIRVTIASGADFCGLILENGKMFPSILRKYNKVTAHRFRNHEHFCEYQESLRDWSNRVESFNSEMVKASNAKLYNTCYESIRSMYETIVSVSHIDYNKFCKQF